jgi:hypothetical protein
MASDRTTQKTRLRFFADGIPVPRWLKSRTILIDSELSSPGRGTLAGAQEVSAQWTLVGYALCAGADGRDVDDYAAWVARGAELASELKRQEEDVLAQLALSPSGAAEAMVTLFENTLDHIEHPLPIEQGMEPDEVVQLWKEQKAAVDQFWKRCDELAALIVRHPGRGA